MLLPLSLGLGAMVTALLATSVGTVNARSDLFALITIGGSLLVMAVSLVAVAVADQQESAETGLLAGAVLAASVISLVVGITSPGLIYSASASSSVIAGLFIAPVFALGMFPAVMAGSPTGRWAAEHWRDWVLMVTVGTFIVGAALAGFPALTPRLAVDHPITVGVALAGALAVWAVSIRFRCRPRQTERFVFRVSRLALGLVACGTLATIVGGDTIAAYVLRACSLAGFVLLCGTSIKMSSGMRPIVVAFGPVIEHDLRLAIDLGASPAVIDHLEASAGTRELEAAAELARMAMHVSASMGMTAEECVDVGLAAVMHDIGKAALPPHLLGKPSRLTDEEYQVIQRHPVIGAAMLDADPVLASIIPIVRSHHERVDGRGYPDGLIGDEIPLGARIVSCCDAFDALTQDRPYRRRLTSGTALAVLREHAGSQWDADIVQQLTTMVAGSSLDVVSQDIPEDLSQLLTAVDSEI